MRTLTQQQGEGNAITWKWARGTACMGSQPWTPWGEGLTQQGEQVQGRVRGSEKGQGAREIEMSFCLLVSSGCRVEESTQEQAEWQW